MGRPYSLDLRDRVARFVVAGGTCRKAAERFGVGVATAVRWAQRLRAEGSPAARRMGGHRPLVLAGKRDWLLARIREQPDLTLRAIQAELAERGVAVSYDAVWRFYQREAITFKKSLFAAEQDRPDVARKRDRWKRYQARLDPKRLVFIDETPAFARAGSGPRPT